mmetsp:Transcript_60370/g.169246  ORF Transcript_60370/g.169246 Transcript_60370/m.169246 type:complete len:256 (-) Transcript_60370:78-845(-)
MSSIGDSALDINTAVRKLGAACKDGDFKASGSTVGSPGGHSDIPPFCPEEAGSPEADRFSSARPVLGDDVDTPCSNLTQLGGRPFAQVDQGPAESDGGTPCSTVTQLCGKPYAELGGDAIPSAELQATRRKPKANRIDFLSTETHVNGQQPDADVDALDRLSSCSPCSLLTHINGTPIADLAKVLSDQPDCLRNLSTDTHLNGEDLPRSRQEDPFSMHGGDRRDMWVDQRLQLMSEKSTLLTTPCGPILEDEEHD